MKKILIGVIVVMAILIILSIIDNDEFSGSVMVQKGDDIIMNEAYGYSNKQEKSLNTINTVYSIGSLSKQFTAAAIIKLAEDGQLNVHDPISNYLDDVTEDKRLITIEQLLTHSSGLDENHFENDLELMDKSTAYERIMASSLVDDPGRSFNYSNSGYTLLAIIIENVSGMSYTDFMEKRVFSVIGLNETGFYGDEKFVSMNVANGYHWIVDNGNPMSVGDIQWGPMGNGEILSTTGDLSKWFRLLYNGHFIKDDVYKSIFEKQFMMDESSYYGYGFSIGDYGDGLEIDHDGAGLFGNAYLRYYVEEDLLIVVLSNEIKLKKLLGIIPYGIAYPAQDFIDEYQEEYFQRN